MRRKRSARDVHGPIEQATFLRRLGIETRAEALKKGVAARQECRGQQRAGAPDQRGSAPAWASCSRRWQSADPEARRAAGIRTRRRPAGAMHGGTVSETHARDAAASAMLHAASLASLPGIRHAFFTRQGGVSGGIYESLNGGVGSRDAAAHVAENRALMAAGARRAAGEFPHRLSDPFAGRGDRRAALGAGRAAARRCAGDARSPGIAVGVSTADCGPILFADAGARVIGAAHAGWRGAFTGVIEATIAAMETLGAEPRQHRRRGRPDDPASRTTRSVRNSSSASRPTAPRTSASSRRAAKRGHAMFDLAGYIAARLSAAGIRQHRGHRPLHLCRRRHVLQLSALGAPQRSRLRPAYQRDRAVRLTSL